MVRYAGAGSRLRALFQDVPESLLPKPEPPSRLTDEDFRLNYRFVRDDGTCDPCELLHRVRRGVKPVATVLIKIQDTRYATDRAVLGASKGLGLRCLLFHVKGGRREAAVFQATAKLSDFYDPDEVVARYKQAGVTLDPGIFSAALEGLARAVVTQNLAAELTLPVTGLCLGYPIESTLELLKGQTAKK